jgi:hypothetical protein
MIENIIADASAELTLKDVPAPNGESSPRESGDMGLTSQLNNEMIIKHNRQAGIKA